MEKLDDVIFDVRPNLRPLEDGLREMERKLKEKTSKGILLKVGIDTREADRELDAFVRRATAKLTIKGKVVLDTSEAERKLNSLSSMGGGAFGIGQGQTASAASNAFIATTVGQYFGGRSQSFQQGMQAQAVQSASAAAAVAAPNTGFVHSVAGKNCPRCGTPNAANAIFCRACGNDFRGSMLHRAANVVRPAVSGVGTVLGGLGSVAMATPSLVAGAINVGVGAAVGTGKAAIAIGGALDRAVFGRPERPKTLDDLYSLQEAGNLNLINGLSGVSDTLWRSSIAHSRSMRKGFKGLGGQLAGLGPGPDLSPVLGGILENTAGLGGIGGRLGALDERLGLLNTSAANIYSHLSRVRDYSQALRRRAARQRRDGGGGGGGGAPTLDELVQEAESMTAKAGRPVSRRRQILTPPEGRPDTGEFGFTGARPSSGDLMATEADLAAGFSTGAFEPFGSLGSLGTVRNDLRRVRNYPWRLRRRGSVANPFPAMGNMLRGVGADARGLWRGLNPEIQGLVKATSATAILSAVGETLNVNNQNTLRNAGATNVDQIIQNQLDYNLSGGLQGSFVRGVPIVGPVVQDFGGGLGQFAQNLQDKLTGGKKYSYLGGLISGGGNVGPAAAARNIAALNIARQTGQIMTGALQSHLGSMAEVAGYQGFAGQRQANNLNAKGELVGRQQDIDTQIASLSGINTDEAKAQIFQLRRNRNEAAKDVEERRKAKNDEINRQEKVSVLTSASNVRISSLGGIDDREANRESIRARFHDRLNSNDAGERARAQTEMDTKLQEEGLNYNNQSRFMLFGNKVAGLAANGYGLQSTLEGNRMRMEQQLVGVTDPTRIAAIKGERNIADKGAMREFNIDLKEMEGNTKAAAQALGGNSLQAALTSIETQRKTALEREKDPRRQAKINAQFDQQAAAAKVGDARERALFGLGTRSLNQSTNRQLMRNTGHGIAADAQGILDSTEQQIAQLNLEFGNTTDPKRVKARDERIKALRKNADAQIEGVRSEYRFSMKAEQIGAFENYAASDQRGIAAMQDIANLDKQRNNAQGAMDEAAKPMDVGDTTNGWSSGQVERAIILLDQIAQNVGVQ